MANLLLPFNQNTKNKYSVSKVSKKGWTSTQIFHGHEHEQKKLDEHEHLHVKSKNLARASRARAARPTLIQNLSARLSLT
jgi:hypothetical protein